MSISAQYSKEIRKNLSYFPSWEPGDTVSPGDVGELVKGVFIRQRTLRDIFPDLSLAIGREAQPNRMSFHSQNAISIEVKEAGSVPGLDIDAAKASAEITFSRAGAVIFHAANCSRRFIENLGETREHVEKHRGSWPEGYALVSHVEDAESFAVLISGSAGASVKLLGTLAALQQFQLAEGSVSITGARYIGYQRTGTGTVLLRLYGLGFFGGGKLLSGGEKPAHDPGVECRELSARDEAFD